jgi:hypothetical protein
MDPESLGKAAAGLMPVLQKTGQSPLQIVGRVAGLGAYEMRAGIPKWAWAGIGIVTGITVMWMWGDKIKGFAKR